MQNTWREMGKLAPRLRRSTTWRRLWWPTVKSRRDHDGGTSGQPTASNGWRLGLRHGRHDQRQATTSERQRLVRQEAAATRHSHTRRWYGKDVRPTNSLRRTDLNLTATYVNGSTSARSPTTPVDTQFSSGTHTLGLTVRQLRQRLSGYCHSPF